MVITGKLTFALVQAIIMTGFNVPLPNIHVVDKYPEPYQDITAEAFCTNGGDAYGTETTTQFQWLDEICEKNFGWDINFPKCDSFVSEYCEEHSEECNSEWCQKYIEDGKSFRIESSNNKCTKQIYDYIKSKLVVEFNTFSIYGYSVSNNYLYHKY